MYYLTISKLGRLIWYEDLVLLRLLTDNSGSNRGISYDRCYISAVNGLSDIIN